MAFDSSGPSPLVQLPEGSVRLRGEVSLRLKVETEAPRSLRSPLERMSRYPLTTLDHESLRATLNAAKPATPLDGQG